MSVKFCMEVTFGVLKGCLSSGALSNMGAVTVPGGPVCPLGPCLISKTLSLLENLSVYDAPLSVFRSLVCPLDPVSSRTCDLGTLSVLWNPVCRLEPCLSLGPLAVLGAHICLRCQFLSSVPMSVLGANVCPRGPSLTLRTLSDLATPVCP